MEKLLRTAHVSGSLDLSNRCLQHVPEQVYKLLDVVGPDEKWWEVVELQKLVLSHNKIASLSDELGNLSSITVLQVNHNELTYLPSSLGRLSLLKYLDYSGNLIKELPLEIGNTTALVRLQGANNLLSELPSSIGKCINLLELQIAKNLLTSLPDELCHCSRLIKLDLEGNKLVKFPKGLLSSFSSLTELNAAKNLLNEMPEELGYLSSLVRLDLHQNRITAIQSSLAGCSALVELFLGENLISNIPKEISALQSLGTLDLHANQLRDYPVEACSLRLSVLDLSNNNLSGLPAELGMMTTLRKLLVMGNPVKSLRSSLVTGSTPALLQYLRSRMPAINENVSASSASSGNIFGADVKNQFLIAAREATTSKALSLCGKRLESVPSAAWEVGDLAKLDLSKNDIEVLPTDISMCTRLEVLLLADNKIQKWQGQSFASLTSLRHLVLAGNPLQEFPPGAFKEVCRLQILDLSGISAALPNPALSDMPNLRELYLRRMRLNYIPSDVPKLIHLQILDVSQNMITTVPEEMTCLTQLEQLDLSDNNISLLPPKLGLLEPSLCVLKFDGNPLRSIRRTVLDRGTKALLLYLKDKILS